MSERFAYVGRQDPVLTRRERAALAAWVKRPAPVPSPQMRADLARLVDPIEAACAGLGDGMPDGVRKTLLAQTLHRSRAYWSWDEDAWVEAIEVTRRGGRRYRGLSTFVALGYLLAGHRRLHHRLPTLKPKHLAADVFGADIAESAVDEVLATLRSWGITALQPAARQALYDALLSNGSPRLEDLTSDLLNDLVQAAPAGSTRRLGLFRLSRVLSHRGIIGTPLIVNTDQRGPTHATLASVPQPWRDYTLRWLSLSTREPISTRSMLSGILIAGRWTAEHHPEAVDPQDWTRDIAAEYVAATLHARVGQWGSGTDHNRSRLGQELSASGKANRMDSVRGFFNDLIEWEWIRPRFNPRQVLSLPLSVRAQLGPNPRIIDDASWAKLMAAGLTLTEADLRTHGTPRAHAAGRSATYYPIDMVRALIGVWLFAGCRIDEIRRLELHCITWDSAIDETTGESFRVCLLHVPANKTSRPFSKPVDPIVGELIEAWQAIRPEQPDLVDRKTGRHRQHLFCVRGQIVGGAYLNTKLIPILCAKAGIPETDSRGALTSHRARATIATQLLNAREPLSIADLQQWLGHKHIASTRYYAEILQRVLSAAYKRADYFARNVRTIQVLIDRDAILTGAAAGGNQPWKYYDLGDGYCSYDFFAKCPHRMACARCPFYVPKDSTRGQLLAVKDGIGQMLEQLTLTDDEREALEGDRKAVSALLDRLANIPTPAGQTPQQLGVEPAFIPLSALTTSRARHNSQAGPPMKAKTTKETT